MRIVGGSLRGRKLKLPVGGKIRPTSDRTRESVFNLLGPDFMGEKALDLFSGTGALGIESLSRGFEKAVFVDQDKLALVITRENLERCDLLQRARLEGCRVSEYLSRPDPWAPFDLILADPPYKKGLLAETLDTIARSDWIARSGHVVFESERFLTLPEQVGCLQLLKRRTYGDSCIHIYCCKECS